MVNIITKMETITKECLKLESSMERVNTAGPTEQNILVRVATKIFEGFGERLSKEFIKGQEPVPSVHYTRPGTCINRPLH